jgi:transposase
MNKGKYVYAQLTDFIPRRVFDGIVSKYDGNKYVKSFSCWNQLLCMVFGQLISCESMRELMYSLEAHKTKFYHLGFGNNVARRTLGEANEKRSYKIFEDFACVLMAEARKSYYKNDFEINIEGNVYAFDSSTVDLCLSVFWWAKFRKNKGGIKLHTLYDVKTYIPCFIHITSASVHDVNGLDQLSYEPDSYYIFDKGYIDFRRLYLIHQNKSYFVTRAKDNMKFQRMYSNKADKENGIIYDQTGKTEKL